MNSVIRWFYSAPGSGLALGLGLTLLAGMGLPRLEIRTDGAALHPPNAPAVMATKEASQQFSEPEQIYILITRRNEDAPMITTQEGLLFLEQIHKELGRMKETEAVTSVTDVLDVPDAPNLLCLPAYLDSVPTSPANFSRLLERMQSEPYVYGLLLASDGASAIISVARSDKINRSDFVRLIEDKARTLENESWSLLVTGPTVAETTLGDMVLKDLARLIPIMVAIMTLVLFLTLRTPAALMIVMTEVGLVLVWILGLMGWMGVPITLVTTILPVLLMTMAVTDEIHLMERFQHFLDHHTRKIALEKAIGAVARPVFLTSITTALGFLSFTTADIEPIRDFGHFAALGMVMAMVLTFTLIPSLLIILPAWTFRPLTHFRLPKIAVSVPQKAPVLVLLLLLPAFWGISRLEVQDAWVQNFDKQSPLVRADRIINDSFWGSYRYDVTLTAPDGFFHTPEGIVLARELEHAFARVSHVGGVFNFLAHFDKIRALQKASHQDYDTHRIKKILEIVRIAGDRMGIEQLLTQDGSGARFKIFVRDADYQRGLELDRSIQALLSQHLPDNLRYRVSGSLPLAQTLVGEIVANQLQSMEFTLLGIALVLIVLFRSIRQALILLIPVMMALIMLGGFMGLAQIPLGIATSMFAAIALGVGIDFSIHFAHVYNRLRREGMEHEEACHKTNKSVGRALRWNTLVLVSGFLVLTASALRPDVLLGILLASSMLVTFAMTMILLPFCLKRI